MREFENHVQKVKNEVYAEVTRLVLKGRLDTDKMDIAEKLNPGPNPRFRCCIYHERAVTNARVKSTIAGIDSNKNVVEVLNSACNGCTPNRYAVSDMCRGCISNRCRQSCPVGAISIVGKKAMIDNEKCIECGKCKAACPYDAIADVKRPCMKACPVNAITVSQDGQAAIDDEQCVRCGACVQICPFGAVQDRSEIVQVIEELKSKTSPMIAMVAPSIAEAFGYTQVGKVVSAIKQIGFKDVVEVALGADSIIHTEAAEFVDVLKEDGVMTSSCCPAFVNYIKKKYPQLTSYISKTVSPMVQTAKIVKTVEPQSKVVFIGPCIAKKEEMSNTVVDYVLTFEELSGMIDLDGVEEMEEAPLDNASYYGRKFAMSGGVSMALKNQLGKYEKLGNYDVIGCEGFDEIDKTLRLLKAGRLKRTFIEGMACKGGCVKGPVSINLGDPNRKAFEIYCNSAYEKDSDAFASVLNWGKKE